MRKGLDDAVRWNDGDIFEHETLESSWGHDVIFDGQGGVHDQSALVELEEVGRMRIL